MSKLEHLIMMAEDELVQYSTTARKIEKLRQKVGLSLNIAEQQQAKAELLEVLPTDDISQIVEKNRQTISLPFWGIAGLGLLLGISMEQPLDFIATVVGTVAAIALQKWGWSLQAKRLVLQTLEDIEERSKR
ncbi:hypothetical protein [Pseudanabaena mucicola]|uniref:Uncharacterized protein n=1 Tax=Pseudanabaena mucicola FACHB-723 TaxID=2692860 RepID=A0ABR7ZW93_9CYAN|nr:hypothetical protein [Pseudanabaena mucicola]MBD2188208.1 hypothetical protein [Pseudanabaena mucicola FACHB-723]